MFFFILFFTQALLILYFTSPLCRWNGLPGLQENPELRQDCAAGPLQGGAAAQAARPTQDWDPDLSLDDMHLSLREKG